MSAPQITFEPELAIVGRFPALATIEQMADEVGVHSASPDFVREHCGPLANGVLDRIPGEFYAECDRLGLYPNIDVRVHRLYPGDLPAFPGWHCDGEYRETYHCQPDLARVPRHAHLVGTISTDPDGVSLTEFVADPFTTAIVDPSAENPLWGQVHRAVQEHRDALTIRTARDGALTQFGSLTLHRATPARTRGWRLFFRMSMWHKPYLGDGGRITRQEQVYQVTEGRGW